MEGLSGIMRNNPVDPRCLSRGFAEVWPTGTARVKFALQPSNRPLLPADTKPERCAEDELHKKEHKSDADHQEPFAGRKIDVVQEGEHRGILTGRFRRRKQGKWRSDSL